MKKIFAIILTVCLMASVLCIPAFAEDSASAMVTISGLKKNGTTVGLNSWTDFAAGWEAAVDFAEDEDFMEEQELVRIIVDFHGDWKANAAGEFGDSDGDGFRFSTIYVPSDTRMTLNLNGHTINRGLTEWEYDGEVICINDDADVIINNGTITGGWSCNGAGGIHVQDGAKLELNDVHIVGNIADDDNGGGIALYDGAELVMNGGSFRDNAVDGVTDTNLDYHGGAVYVNDSTAIFNKVEFKNNQTTSHHGYGAAIYAHDSTVTVNECAFDGNGIADEDNNIYAPISVLHATNSSLLLKKSTFTNNGAKYSGTNFTYTEFSSALIFLDDATLTMDDCKVSHNAAYRLLQAFDGDRLYISNSTFTDNDSIVLHSEDHSDQSYFRSCTFNNNKVNDPSVTDNTFASIGNTLTFYDCDLGDSTFYKGNLAVFVNTKAPIGAGSIFSAGSLTMIVAILALAASVSSIGISFALYQKKAVPASANDTADSNSED